MNSRAKRIEDQLSPSEIIKQASVPDKDQIVRQIRRGKETGIDGDDKDVAGAPAPSETPQGREEAKKHPHKEGSRNDR